MSSSTKKRKSRDVEAEDPTTMTLAISAKKRRRSSTADEDGAKLERKKSKKDKDNQKDKKSKKSKTESQPEDDEKAEDEPMADFIPLEADEESKPTKKSKKEKKDKKKSKKDFAATVPDTKTDDTKKPVKSTEPLDVDTPTTADDQDAATNSNAKQRFIVFVGNLPYTATTEQITSHFSSVHPTSVRLLHEKNNPKKSRGIAFVEFARYDHMKTALKLYHHSIFKVPKAATGANVPIRGNKNKDRRGRNDTTTDGPFEERKINVELTVGGGGNTDYRKQRIKEKNEKLNDERARRAQEEQRIKDKKAREKAGKGDDEEEGKKSGGGMEDAIHPSRRRHLEGASS